MINKIPYIITWEILGPNGDYDKIAAWGNSIRDAFNEFCVNFDDDDIGTYTLTFIPAVPELIEHIEEAGDRYHWRIIDGTAYPPRKDANCE